MVLVVCYDKFLACGSLVGFDLTTFYHARKLELFLLDTRLHFIIDLLILLSLESCLISLLDGIQAIGWTFDVDRVLDLDGRVISTEVLFVDLVQSKHY